MASPDVDVAVGITVVFGTTGFSAQIVDITMPTQTRDSIDTSYQGTVGAKTFTPADLYDNGEMGITGHFNPDLSVPIDQPAETITVTWPSGATWAFDGFMTNTDGNAALNTKEEFTATIKISGLITITPAA